MGYNSPWYFAQEQAENRLLILRHNLNKLIVSFQKIIKLML